MCNISEQVRTRRNKNCTEYADDFGQLLVWERTFQNFLSFAVRAVISSFHSSFPCFYFTTSLFRLCHVSPRTIDVCMEQLDCLESCFDFVSISKALNSFAGSRCQAWQSRQKVYIFYTCKRSKADNCWMEWRRRLDDRNRSGFLSAIFYQSQFVCLSSIDCRVSRKSEKRELEGSRAVKAVREGIRRFGRGISQWKRGHKSVKEGNKVVKEKNKAMKERNKTVGERNEAEKQRNSKTEFEIAARFNGNGEA